MVVFHSYVKLPEGKTRQRSMNEARAFALDVRLDNLEDNGRPFQFRIQKNNVRLAD
jgi:hypothetical protein